MEVILTGEPLSVDRAYGLGLVNQVVAPGEEIAAAIALAEKIALAAPLAVAASRRVILASAYSTDEELIAMTNKEFAPILRSEDTQEGLTAFIEKRAPQWKGR
jgi:enoyl-CoA hydratase